MNRMNTSACDENWQFTHEIGKVVQNDSSQVPFMKGKVNLGTKTLFH